MLIFQTRNEHTGGADALPIVAYPRGADAPRTESSVHLIRRWVLSRWTTKLQTQNIHRRDVYERV